MKTIDKVRILCAEHNITIKQLERELSFSNGSLSKAKNISSDRLSLIAFYFQVSMDDLRSDTSASFHGKFVNEHNGVESMYTEETIQASIDERREFYTIDTSLDYLIPHYLQLNDFEKRMVTSLIRSILKEKD